MSNDKKDYELFPGKTLSNVFKDIYENSKNTGTQVGNLITDLKKFVNTLDTAVVIVPLIKEYLDVKVKSDEHLVKLSDTIQRMLRAEKTGDNDGLLISEEEKLQILEEVPSYEQIRAKEQNRLDKLGKEVDTIKREFEANEDNEEDVIQNRQE